MYYVKKNKKWKCAGNYTGVSCNSIYKYKHGECPGMITNINMVIVLANEMLTYWDN